VRPSYLKMLLALLALAAAGRGIAQVERSGGGANAQLAAQYQQAIAERTQLQAENDKLKKDLDEAKKQLHAATTQLTGARAGVSSTQTQLAAALASSQGSAQALEQSKARMQELVDRFRDTATSLRSVEAERTQLQQQLAQGKTDLDRCADSNYKLYELDREVLDRYEHQGPFSYLARAEPFTRLKRTQIENFVDEYRARAEQLRVQKTPQAVTGKN